MIRALREPRLARPREGARGCRALRSVSPAKAHRSDRIEVVEARLREHDALAAERDALALEQAAAGARPSRATRRRARRDATVYRRRAFRQARDLPTAARPARRRRTCARNPAGSRERARGSLCDSRCPRCSTSHDGATSGPSAGILTAAPTTPRAKRYYQASELAQEVQQRGVDGLGRLLLDPVPGAPERRSPRAGP